MGFPLTLAPTNVSVCVMALRARKAQGDQTCTLSTTQITHAVNRLFLSPLPVELGNVCCLGLGGFGRMVGGTQL